MLSNHLPRSWETRDLTEYRSNILYGREAYQWIVKTLNGPEPAAIMASFYTEQQSVDVREGLQRRIQEGWFVGKAPYGYPNIRKNGRGIVEIHPEAGPHVRRNFELFAYHNLTLDSLSAQLDEEGRRFRESFPKFPRSSLHSIIRDRAYIGELEFRGPWHPDNHEPLTDRATWDRVQALLGGHVDQAHEMTYAGERIVCGHCGQPSLCKII